MKDAESRQTAVCFTGHRRIKSEDVEDLISKLDVVIDRCVSKGLVRFMSGGALGFDTLAAKRVLLAKEKHPQISLSLILPCRDQTKKWTSLVDINEYRTLKDCADEIIYIQDFYDADCMMKRNKYMIDNSSLCIAYHSGRTGGTANTVRYAAEQKIKVINLYTKTRALPT
ncbi:MAG: DUF1273 family protein [Clostridia bacterium]|nr:DUF1273 family protein [Clostridia bacterium]